MSCAGCAPTRIRSTGPSAGPERLQHELGAQNKAGAEIVEILLLFPLPVQGKETVKKFLPKYRLNLVRFGKNLSV